LSFHFDSPQFPGHNRFPTTLNDIKTTKIKKKEKKNEIVKVIKQQNTKKNIFSKWT